MQRSGGHSRSSCARSWPEKEASGKRPRIQHTWYTDYRNSRSSRTVATEVTASRRCCKNAASNAALRRLLQACTYHPDETLDLHNTNSEAQAVSKAATVGCVPELTGCMAWLLQAYCGACWLAASRPNTTIPATHQLEGVLVCDGLGPLCHSLRLLLRPTLQQHDASQQQQHHSSSVRPAGTQAMPGGWSFHLGCCRQLPLGCWYWAGRLGARPADLACRCSAAAGWSFKLSDSPCCCWLSRPWRLPCCCRFEVLVDVAGLHKGDSSCCCWAGAAADAQAPFPDLGGANKARPLAGKELLCVFRCF
jgi:hypothetical protein